MDALNKVKNTWNHFAATNPMWSILTGNENWDINEFYKTGIDEAVVLIGDWLKPGGSILDFGCGVGRMSEAFLKYYDEVTGIDISENMLKLAKERNSGVNYVLNATDDLSVFSDNKFDCVFSVIVLQHMCEEMQTKYIKEFVRVTKPGGRMAFQIPSHHISGQRSFDHPDKEIVMEMHGLPQETVLDLLKDCEVTINPNNKCGDHWISYTYLVDKK